MAGGNPWNKLQTSIALSLKGIITLLSSTSFQIPYGVFQPLEGGNLPIIRFDLRWQDFT